MTTPNTTEQELREKLTKLLNDEEICRCGRHYKSSNFAHHICPENGLRHKIMQLITQYGDTRERFGRLDELDIVASEEEGTGIDGFWVEARLAELKEEV